MRVAVSSARLSWNVAIIIARLDVAAAGHPPTSIGLIVSTRAVQLVCGFVRKHALRELSVCTPCGACTARTCYYALMLLAWSHIAHPQHLLFVGALFDINALASALISSAAWPFLSSSASTQCKQFSLPLSCRLPRGTSCGACTARTCHLWALGDLW